MVNVGFICEGDSEKIILESGQFRDYLSQLNLHCIDPGINVGGGNNLLPEYLNEHTQKLNRSGAEYIIILSDLDEDQCITANKERIQPLEDQQVIVAVQQLEAWFLADHEAISKALKFNLNKDNPEGLTDLFQYIRDQSIENTGRGIGSKVLFAKKMVKSGFKIAKAAEHPNCPSAQYFVGKLGNLTGD